MQESHEDAQVLQRAWNQTHGERLRELRRSRGLLQAELADRLEVPRSVLSNWETGARRPGPRYLDRLASVLSVALSNFHPAVAEPVERAHSVARTAPALDQHDQIRELAADAVSSIVTDEQRPEIDRFLRLVRVFERLEGAGAVPARRWAKTRVDADDYRARLQSLSGQNTETRDVAGRIGSQLAHAARKRLDLADAPLPSVEVLGEMFGVNVFRIPFAPAPGGRMRGLLVESGTVGANLLLNADLTAGSQRLVMADCVAQAILQPAGGVTVVASRPQRSRSNLRTAAEKFSRELAFPSRLADLQLGAVLTGLADRPDDESAGLVQSIVHLSQIYGVPPAMVEVATGRRLRPDQRKAIATDVLIGLQRVRRPRRTPPPDSSWTLTPEDVPQRLLQRLLDGIAGGAATLAGVAQLTGLAEMDLEALLAAFEAVDVDGLEANEWSDSWHVDVA